jgi:hypothetical protein
MSSPPPLEWFVSGIIERRKLEEYPLSPTHSDGKNKLRLWRASSGSERVMRSYWSV